MPRPARSLTVSVPTSCALALPEPEAAALPDADPPASPCGVVRSWSAVAVTPVSSERSSETSPERRSTFWLPRVRVSPRNVPRVVERSVPVVPCVTDPTLPVTWPSPEPESSCACAVGARAIAVSAAAPRRCFFMIMSFPIQAEECVPASERKTDRSRDLIHAHAIFFSAPGNRRTRARGRTRDRRPCGRDPRPRGRSPCASRRLSAELWPAARPPAA